MTIIDMRENNGSLETIMLHCVRASFPACKVIAHFHALMMSKTAADDAKKLCNTGAS